MITPSDEGFAKSELPSRKEMCVWACLRWYPDLTRRRFLPLLDHFRLDKQPSQKILTCKNDPAVRSRHFLDLINSTFAIFGTKLKVTVAKKEKAKITVVLC